MKRIIKGSKVTWVDIKDPTEEDIEYLRQKFHIHPLVLGELIPPGHRPKVERHNDYLFMIIYYPIYSKEKRETNSRELDIIATQNTIITSHYSAIFPLKTLFNACYASQNSRKRYMSDGSGQLLFYILSNFWKACLVKMEQIDKRIDEVEKNIFSGKEKEMVLEISFVKTDIINFWRIVEPQKEILESLAKEGIVFFGKALNPYFADILGTYGKALNSLKTFKETVLAMEDTNQSLLSTKTNETIRILTVFSVIMLPLTLLASIWGMNLPNLPLAESPVAFWFLISLMIGLVGFLVFYFRKKEWL